MFGFVPPYAMLSPTQIHKFTSQNIARLPILMHHRLNLFSRSQFQKLSFTFDHNHCQSHYKPIYSFNKFSWLSASPINFSVFCASVLNYPPQLHKQLIPTTPTTMPIKLMVYIINTYRMCTINCTQVETMRSESDSAFPLFADPL